MIGLIAVFAVTQVAAVEWAAFAALAATPFAFLAGLARADLVRLARRAGAGGGARRDARARGSARRAGARARRPGAGALLLDARAGPLRRRGRLARRAARPPTTPPHRGRDPRASPRSCTTARWTRRRSRPRRRGDRAAAREPAPGRRAARAARRAARLARPAGRGGRRRAPPARAQPPRRGAVAAGRAGAQPAPRAACAWPTAPTSRRSSTPRSTSSARASSELRDLARGIHPVVLSERGLDPAVRALAARATVPVEVLGETAGRLPAAVETAAYFVISEALTNVSKYAHAAHATVTVERVDGQLLVEVRDDGVGGASAPRRLRAARALGSRGRAQRHARGRQPARPRDLPARPPALRVIRVVVAEDSFLFRAGMVRVLEGRGPGRSWARRRDAEELLDAVRAQRPDVAVTDIRMPPTQTDEGVRAAMLIRAEFPATGVLVLSQFVNESYALRLLGDSAAGVGYLLKQRVTEPDGLRRRGQAGGARRLRARSRGRGADARATGARAVPSTCSPPRERAVLAGDGRGALEPRDRPRAEHRRGRVAAAHRQHLRQARAAPRRRTATAACSRSSRTCAHTKADGWLAAPRPRLVFAQTPGGPHGRRVRRAGTLDAHDHSEQLLVAGLAGLAGRRRAVARRRRRRRPRTAAAGARPRRRRGRAGRRRCWSATATRTTRLASGSGNLAPRTPMRVDRPHAHRRRDQVLHRDGRAAAGGRAQARARPDASSGGCPA